MIKQGKEGKINKIERRKDRNEISQWNRKKERSR